MASARVAQLSRWEVMLRSRGAVGADLINCEFDCIPLNLTTHHCLFRLPNFDRANVQAKRTFCIATAGWLVNDLRPF